MRYLSNKRVLLTGGSGFLGRAVQAALLSHAPMEVVLVGRNGCDLTRQRETEDFVASIRPHVVIHLAAEVGGIGANQANPGRYFYANMAMALNLIEASRLVGVEKFVQVGTVCSYPKFTPVPFREDELWSGYPEETNAPYGVAKKAALVMLQAYRNQYGFRSAYPLPVNLYGPWDNFDLQTSHVIPALIRRLIEARRTQLPRVRCWGSGRASREFLYVDDCADAVVRAAERLDEPVPVNLGSGGEIAIAELAALIADLVGYKGRLEWDTSRPDGQPRRCLDVSRARQLLDWQATTPLEEGLRRTIAWYEQLPSRAASAGNIS